MKNSLIFGLLVVMLICATIGATTNRSTSGTVEGLFEKNICRVNHQWAYLRDSVKNEILDSCLIINNKFTLTGQIPGNQYPCRITFSKLRIAPRLYLSRDRKTALTIASDTTRDFTPSPKPDSTMSARADSLHRQHPDSLTTAK